MRPSPFPDRPHYPADNTKQQTIADVNVRSHTFRFITPGDSERLKVPNACVGCHTDKNNAWASEQLKRWPELSPWRVASRDDGSRITPGTSFSVPRRVP